MFMYRLGFNFYLQIYCESCEIDNENIEICVCLFGLL